MKSKNLKILNVEHQDSDVHTHARWRLIIYFEKKSNLSCCVFGILNNFDKEN